MRDDHHDSEILVNEFGIFVRLRKAYFQDRPDCPLCDEPMDLLQKPPMRFQSANHYLSYASNFDFFACPDRDYPGHRRAESTFRAACTFWIKPFNELFNLSDAELFRSRRDS